jgi:26S proteasome regulatory subunit N1
MAPKDKEGITLTANSSDAPAASKNKKKDGATDDLKDAMSEEDKELKERLETCVSTVLNEHDESAVTVGLRLNALQVIVQELRSATSSMTSVPKPLKFLRPHFAKLQDLHSHLQTQTTQRDLITLRARLGDVLAVLAMTMGKPGKHKKSVDITCAILD